VEPWNHALEKARRLDVRMIDRSPARSRCRWTSLEGSPARSEGLLLYGSGDETMSIRWSEGGRTALQDQLRGHHPMLMRRFKGDTSESHAQHYLRYFSDKPASACQGERLRPESRAVTIGDVGETPGKSIVQVSRIDHRASMQLVSPCLEGSDKVVASELLKEIRATASASCSTSSRVPDGWTGRDRA